MAVGDGLATGFGVPTCACAPVKKATKPTRTHTLKKAIPDRIRNCARVVFTSEIQSHCAVCRKACGNFAGDYRSVSVSSGQSKRAGGAFGVVWSAIYRLMITELNRGPSTSSIGWGFVLDEAAIIQHFGTRHNAFGDCKLFVGTKPTAVDVLCMRPHDCGYERRLRSFRYRRPSCAIQ